VHTRACAEFEDTKLLCAAVMTRTQEIMNTQRSTLFLYDQVPSINKSIHQSINE